MMKETFYFSHDYNARSDEKIKLLLRKHGVAGYGIFWSLIEDLYNNANALRTDYEGIAYEYHTDEKLIKSIINDFGLFIVDGEIFGSASIERRINERDKKSIKARESAFYRWGKVKDDANALRTECERNAIKEKKEKEKKVKESKGEDIPHQPFSQIPVKPTDFSYQQTIDEFLVSQAWMEGLAMAFKKDYEFIKTDSLDFLKNLNDKGQFPRDIFDTKRFYYNSLQKKMMETKTRSKREGTLV